MSNSSEHHIQAEELLVRAGKEHDSIDRSQLLAEAQVHATLALSTQPCGAGRPACLSSVLPSPPWTRIWTSPRAATASTRCPAAPWWPGPDATGGNRSPAGRASSHLLLVLPAGPPESSHARQLPSRGFNGSRTYRLLLRGRPLRGGHNTRVQAAPTPAYPFLCRMRPRPAGPFETPADFALQRLSCRFAR